MATQTDHIFFPTDFSKNAKKALPFAAEIARRSGAKLTLLHAFQDTIDFAPNFEGERDELIQKISEQFDVLVDGLIKDERYKELNITTTLLSGHPVANLLEQIEEHKPTLVVMGTKGATGDNNILLGSTTSAIIQKSDVPVLAVPPGSKFDNFKNMIFTTDYKEQDLAALQDLVELAELFDSDINVIHVESERTLETEIKFRGFRELAGMNIAYDKIGFDIEYDYDFFPGIVDYLSDHPASLLVMVRYKRTFLESMFERDHSKEMALYSKIPLLILIGE